MTDERRDDEILGRALARAIETIDVDETPFEESRLLIAPSRSGSRTWQVAGLAAGLVAVLAIASWLGASRVGTEPGPAAAPSPTLSAIPTTQVAVPTQTTIPTTVEHDRIYLARPALPPIAVSGPQFPATVVSPNDRIATLLTGLRAYRQSAAPQGLTNYLWNNAFQGGVVVAIGNDLATVDLRLEVPWTAHDHAEALGILQQLVYTATEEPGIRRALFTQNGGQQMSIGDIRIDKPLAREDVLGYTVRGPIGHDRGIKGGGGTSPLILGSTVMTSNDGTLLRVTFEPRGADGKAAKLPPFEVWMDQSDDRTPTGGKYAVMVSLNWFYNVAAPTGGAAHVRVFDQTPLRATADAGSFWQLELDDARPWRAYVSPDGTRLTVDIGGGPWAVSDRIAVDGPQPGRTVAGEVTVTGAARVFEANVNWRMHDAAKTVVASGHFTATLGSSAVWGTFDTRLAIPGTVHGNVTLELYEQSMKDGSDQGLVAIPLTVP